MFQANQSIFKAFAETAKLNPEKEAIVFKDLSGYKFLTYFELYDKAIRLGNILRDNGIKPNDKISALLENQPEYVISFLASMYVGATFVPFDTQYSIDQIKHLVLHSESKLLITNNKLYSDIKDDIGDLELIIINSERFKEKLNSYSLENRFNADKNKDDIAVLFYTSGTTDLPKAVMLSHYNLLSNFNSLRQSGIIKANDTVISLLPLHHTYPFTVTMLTPLLLAARIAYPPSLTSQDLLDCMRRTKATIFVGVPQLFSLIECSINEKISAQGPLKRVFAYVLGNIAYFLRKNAKINLSKYLFANIHKAFGKDLQFMASGGARLDPKVANTFFRWGFTILEGYGLTETSPVVTFNPFNKPKIASVGKPVPDVEIKIINKDPQGIGEVAIKGPNVMLGYYHMEHQTKEAIKNGWFMSGDLGYLDKEGYLYLTGRKKELIILSNGKNINPEEVEKHYSQSPFIKEICILPIKGASGIMSGVEHLAAIVVINEEYFSAKEETNIRDKLKWELDNLSIELPTYKRIKGFFATKDSLPRTRLGKIMRHKIIHLYTELLKHSQSKQKKSKDKDKTISYSGASEQILSFLKKTLNTDVNINDHLELDLGLDSLARVELLVALQNNLSLELSDEQSKKLFLCNTVGDLLNKLKDLLPKDAKQTQKDKTFIWKKILEENPLQETQKKINLKPGIIALIINFICLIALKIFFRIFFLLKTEGAENLKKEGPYIICPNHTSYLDGLVIVTALPLKIALKTYFVGYSVIFEQILVRGLIKIARLIPLEVSRNLIEALRACSFVLKNSKIVCLFPEGHRSINEEIKNFKKGTSILITELDIPAVPVYIDGCFKAWPRFRKFPKLARIKVKFGKTYSSLELLADRSKDREEDAYETTTDNLRRALIKLKES